MRLSNGRNTITKTYKGLITNIATLDLASQQSLAFNLTESTSLGIYSKLSREKLGFELENKQEFDFQIEDDPYSTGRQTVQY